MHAIYRVKDPRACGVTGLFQKSDGWVQNPVALGCLGVLYPGSRNEAALVVVTWRTDLGGVKPLTLLD